MIELIKKEIKEKGIILLSSNLGYRSPSTILHWIYNDRIPSIAVNKVKKYFKKMYLKEVDHD
jgi:hypothetical protein